MYLVASVRMSACALLLVCVSVISGRMRIIVRRRSIGVLILIQDFVTLHPEKGVLKQSRHICIATYR